MARQWMPMYWGDYARKTQHLSTIEHGAYLLLISHYWNTGNPLPNDDEVLRRITRTGTKQWNTIKDTIKSFFEVRGNELHHDKINGELGRSAGVSTSQSSKAKQRWNSDKKQGEADAGGNATAMPRARVTTTTTTKKGEEYVEPSNPNFKNRERGNSRRAARTGPLSLGSFLAEDWTLPTEWGKWAEQESGFDSKKIISEARKFKAHAAEKGLTSMDWFASWKKWINRAMEHKK